jgi:putative protease
MEILVGKVTHYYNRISVAVVELSGDLKVGDQILILGRTTEITQPVGSMEIEHQKIHSAGAGMEVALQVADPVREGDKVYKVVEA